MKLDEFVKETLLQITNGVSDAQTEAKLFIAPGKIDSETVAAPQMVDFALTVVVDSSGSGNIKVLEFVNLGADVTKSVSHKVSFSVPVYFELQTREHPRGKQYFASPPNK